jgi:predicted RND superfamily exporter protein
VGGEIAALIAGGTVSLGALAGFLAVLVIAARNGVVLISHYQRLQRDGVATLGPPLILRGTQERLVPVLMTALATGLVFLPLVILGNRAGYEIVHPMAIVIVGGLVTSTLLTLFVLPALYLRFGAAELAPAPELELLHRWAGVEPVAADGDRAGVEPVLVDENGAHPAPVDGDGKTSKPVEPEPAGGD